MRKIKPVRAQKGDGDACGQDGKKHIDAGLVKRSIN